MEASNIKAIKLKTNISRTFQRVIDKLQEIVDEAELRECFKEEVDYCCSLCKCKGKACKFDGFCAEQRWRKALEGGNNETK